MSTQALAIATFIPDVIVNTPNPGDVVQVTAVPVGQTPNTQFSPAGSGGGGGVSLPTATDAGLLLVTGPSPSYTPVWGGADAGRY